MSSAFTAPVRTADVFVTMDGRVLLVIDAEEESSLDSIHDLIQ